MDKGTWLKYFEAASEPVQNYLLGNEASHAEYAAQQKLAYDNDAWERVTSVAWDLIFLGTPRLEFKEAIKRVASGRQPEEVEAAVLLYIVLPLGDLIPWDVEARLQELNVSQTEMQGIARVTLRPVSYGAAVRRIASLAKVSLLSEEIVRRTREVLVSYLKGVRNAEQVKTSLMKRQDEGGVGLTDEQAEAYQQAMNDFLALTQVMSEQEYAEWYQRYQNEMQSAKIFAPAETVSDEARALQAAMPGQIHDARGPLEDAIDAALQQIGNLNLDEYIAKRLRNLISTRLRDVRNDLQTRAMLERETKVGGVGLAADVAERVNGIIDETYKSHRASITEEEKNRIEQTSSQQQSKVAERKQRESEEHAQWYEEKMKELRPEEALRRELAALRTPSAASPASPSKVDGIQAPNRLMGLADELGNMTWDSFRRQSRDPEQATQMLREKFASLQRESFERWTEGIQAWRQSPLQKSYLKLVTESFKAGKPVVEVVNEKRKTDATLPTPEELGAVIALNAEIQL